MLLTLLVGCEGPTREIAVPVGPAQEELTRLEAAVAAVNGDRRALLEAADAVTSAATAVDGADEAGTTGNAELAAQARRAAREAADRVPGALAALRDAAAYRASLAQLEQASAPLDATQRAALSAVMAAGEQEAAALEAFGAAAAQAWPAYEGLGEVQATWLDRAQAGWYRERAEAADAYVVLRRPRLPAVEQARTRLQQADAARRPATERMRRQLTAADAALGGLRGPAG